MKKLFACAGLFVITAGVALACSSSSTTTTAAKDGGSAAVDSGGTTGKAIGSDCTANSDCASNDCNMDPQCTQMCTTQADCPAGSVCEKDRPGNCYKECTTNADCAGATVAVGCTGGPNAEGKKWCDVAPPADAGGD